VFLFCIDNCQKEHYLRKHISIGLYKLYFFILTTFIIISILISFMNDSPWENVCECESICSFTSWPPEFQPDQTGGTSATDNGIVEFESIINQMISLN